MDYRRSRLALIGFVLLPALAFPAQGGPVYVDVSPSITPGAACQTNPASGRLRIDSGTGKRWCCVASQWQACGEDSEASVTATGTTTPRALKDIAADVVNVKSFGAKGDGVTDDTVAIQAALTAAGAKAGGGVGFQGGTVAVPAGLYLVSATLDVPYNVSVTLDPQATIRATAAMTAVLRQADNTVVMRENMITGGVWDANGLASDAIWIRNAGGVRVQNLSILNVKVNGLHFGDIGAPNTSYELYVSNVSVWRLSGTSIVAGSRGIFLESGSGDSAILNAKINGVETGIRLDSSNNRVISSHVWSFPSTGWTLVAFDDNGTGNAWVGDYADTPQQTGFLVRANKYNQVFIACKVFVNNIYGVDNTVTGIKFEHTTPNKPFATISGAHFYGSDGTHRIAKIVDAWDTTGIVLVGTQVTNVVSTAPGTNYVSGLLIDTLNVNSSAVVGAQLQLRTAAPSSTRRLEIQSGPQLRWSIGSVTDTESGSNAGTDYAIRAYADDGTFLRQDLWLRRSDGLWSFTGSLSLASGAVSFGSVSLRSDTTGAGGASRRTYVTTGSTLRWGVGSDATAETGSNSGTDYIINSYDDSGALLRNDFWIRRSDGQWTIPGLVKMNGGTMIGSGTPISKSVRATVTTDVASIAAQTTVEVSITATGAAAGADCVPAPPSALPAGLTVSCYVSATDTVKLRLSNPTAAPIDPPSLTYGARVFNP